MFGIIRRTAAAALFVTLFPTSAVRAEERTVALLHAFEEEIEAWDTGAASATLERLEREVGRGGVGGPGLDHHRALLAFYKGDYDRAVSFLSAAPDSPPIRASGGSMEDVIRGTAVATRDFQTARSEHFELRHPPGADAILENDLLRELEEAYGFFAGALGFEPPAPVRIEIFGDTASFLTATTLSERDQRVSGAVGVCKFNKLMILSPRILLRGYRYSATAVHEYVHFMVYRLSRNRAPVWLHEGIASYLEDRFERRVGAGDFRTLLTPTSESALAKALDADALIPFSRMHPSLVKLETRAEVVLAFAQVQMAVEFLMARTQGQGLRRLLAALGGGRDLSEALGEIAGADMTAFEGALQAYLAERGLKSVPDLVPVGLTLREEGGGEEADEALELREIRQKEARDFARLGDLLRARSQFESAVIEYRKARAREPRSPAILNKLGQSLILAGRPKESVSILEECRRLYPDYSTTYYHLGEAYLAQAARDEALAAYREGEALNPFHPVILQRLATLYGELGQADEQARAQEKLRTLVGYGR